MNQQLLMIEFGTSPNNLCNGIRVIRSLFLKILGSKGRFFNEKYVPKENNGILRHVNCPSRMSEFVFKINVAQVRIYVSLRLNGL